MVVQLGLELQASCGAAWRQPAGDHGAAGSGGREANEDPLVQPPQHGLVQLPGEGQTQKIDVDDSLNESLLNWQFPRIAARGQQTTKHNLVPSCMFVVSSGTPNEIT